MKYTCEKEFWDSHHILFLDVYILNNAKQHCFNISGSAAKEFFTKSKLPILELSHIW